MQSFSYPSCCPFRVFFLVLVGLTSVACERDSEAHAIWGGFGYDWETLSHRISYFESQGAEIGDDQTLNFSMGLIGGPWSLISESPEQIDFVQPWWVVQSRSFRGYTGSVDFELGAEGPVSQVIHVSWDDSGLPRGQTYAVLLAGLRWDSDYLQGADYPNDYPPADGWTPQSLGAGVGEVSVDEQGLSFNSWLRFVPGPLDREDMNEAIPYARIGGQLRYLLVALDGGTVSDGSFQAEAYYVADPPNTSIVEIDSEQRTVGISGIAGLATALPGIRSFELHLSESLGLEGRYLRALRMAIDAFSYQPESGEASLRLDAYASHSSFFEEGDLELRWDASLSLLQWDDQEATVVHGAYRGTLPVGPQTVSVEY